MAGEDNFSTPLRIKAVFSVLFLNGLFLIKLSAHDNLACLLPVVYASNKVLPFSWLTC